MKTPPAPDTLLYIGLMSGTSLDGIDAALVAIAPTAAPRLLETHAEPMPEPMRQALLTLCHSDQARFAELASVETQFCALQAKAVQALLGKAGVSNEEIRAIGSHGQTIEHAPQGHTEGPAYTLQLDNPSLLAELTGITVVGDFRRRDLAAGGQAAPLAPAFHQALFSAAGAEQLVLNLGGIANVTWLPGAPNEPVIGFDTGPANVLMDAWFAHHCSKGATERFDKNGAWAKSGRIDTALLDRLLDEPFFRQPPPRSTGRELFHFEWLLKRLNGDENPADVQATLAELTAVSVARAIGELLPSTTRVNLITGGGGAHNAHLMERLGHHLPRATLSSPEAYGWPADWIEAGAFGWLAHRRLENLPGNLPSVTGARGPRVLGGIYAR
ncbi:MULTISPECIES: anhydro-N-acetylmuramic acid kinase [unclassified Halomonas]|uniref:anhydro-N-acetylmuramic acid kinase n=1 Tax=unclassified Halomonas TaxID=2609666 RepID=UPI0021E4D8D9|nr:MULTISPECIES: anhydro-N-acetylmuramic acid kinase [unclassified Halomonas]UYF99545.1 anhydro-N-acetylmuramic acid kinase [Halomonas sp. GD1P12]WNL42705.1 anhydro-N-acetylmuramic acid kinase [Halomonas sp. PAMB 3264]